MQLSGFERKIEESVHERQENILPSVLVSLLPDSLREKKKVVPLFCI